MTSIRLFFLLTCLSLSILSVTALADTSTLIEATEARIEQLSTDIKTANRAKDKEAAQRLREQRSQEQARLRELKQQLKAEKKEAERLARRQAAEAEWRTYPPHKQLCTAVEYNRLDLVKVVVESGSIDLTKPNDACLYPLGEAVSSGFMEISGYLLEKGSPLTARAQMMNLLISAMDVAAQSNEDRTDILALLKRHGGTPYDSAEPQAGHFDPGANPVTAPSATASKPETRIGTTLTKALEKGHINNIRWLLANGAKPDDVSTGRPALMVAIDSSDPEKVRLLVEAGADVNKRGIGGQSVLNHAERMAASASKKRREGLEAIVTYLKSQGATYSDQDRRP